MNRRNFLSLFSTGVAGIALEQAIPFNRVWSFPKNIVIPKLSLVEMDVRYLQPAIRQLLDIGDIVRCPDWPGEFVVSQVAGDDKVHLYSAEQRLVIRGVKAAKLTPILCGDLISQQTISG